MLVNKRGISCQTVEAKSCCRQPKLEFSEFRARLLRKGDRTQVPLLDVTFAPRAHNQEYWAGWQPTIEPVTGHKCYVNRVTGEMAWQIPSLQAASSHGLPSAGTLLVVPMQNKWVALPGPQHDYYQHAQNHYEDRVVRVERLKGSMTNLIDVHIMDEDEQSCRFLSSMGNITQCPQCGHAIERISGCDHLTCKCGRGFNFCNSVFELLA